MPRSGRRFIDGLAYHVLNRANRRATIFKSDGDYRSFFMALADGLDKVPVRVLGACAMPNHFHLVVWPEEGRAISAFMRWFMNAHIRRYHSFHQTWGTGHLYQGRFKAFPIQTGVHLLTVLRYVEANPLRAHLVDRAEQWRWSSLTLQALQDGRPVIAPSPVPRPANWREIVNTPLGMEAAEQMRACVRRNLPYGEDEWVRSVSEDPALRLDCPV